MPFKSEAQRKYLWANEPEIARDWTDEYGSRIQAAQGGRIGFRRGTSGAPGGGDPGMTSDPSGRGQTMGGGEGVHPPAQTPAHTVAPTAQYDDRIQRIAAQDQRTAALRGRASDQGFHQFLTPRTNYQKPTFGMRLRSGLGALGRGIGHVARNFNPISFAFDNPLMKLLASGYGRGNTRNLFQRNNQPTQQMNPELAKYFSGMGITDPNILPEERPTDSLMDDRTLMADLDDMSTYQIKDFKGLDMRDKMEKSGIEIPDPLSDEEKQRLEELRNLRNSGMIGSTGTAVAAQGGIIGSVGGISRPKYQQGNMVGAEMEGAEMEGAEMEGAMMQSQEVIKELYDALIAQGLSPQEAMEKIKEIIASTQTQEPETLGPEGPMMGEEFPGQEFGGGPRAPAAFGGIMDTYTGRRKYGFGSFIKKAFKKVKKLAKSPIGKAALMYVATAGLGNLAGGLGGAQQWTKGQWLLPQNIKTNLLGRAMQPGRWSKLINPKWGPGLGAKMTAPGTSGLTGLLPKYGLTKGAGSMMPTWLGAGAAATAAPFAMQAMGKWDQDQLPGMPGGDQAFDYDYGQMRKDIASAVSGGDYDKFTEVLGNYGLTEGQQVGFWDTLAHGAEGGRVNAQEGGLMDLGGMEKDYRDDGGFVPLGGEEKADDVPARLSKNEFVFTADAVRNAGGGDIDRGAEVMENVMKNLEAGGQVSEESQGQGAEDMFATSERLSEVV